jgi:hypothetical protein
VRAAARTRTVSASVRRERWVPARFVFSSAHKTHKSLANKYACSTSVVGQRAIAHARQSSSCAHLCARHASSRPAACCPESTRGRSRHKKARE